MSEPSTRRLWPNIGAEEGQASRFAGHPAVAATRALWTGLFEAPPALACLSEARGLVPWLCDEDATREAQRAGLPLFGASPEVVARVHDKAFAVSLARQEGFEPAELRPCVRIFESEDLTDADAFAREVEGACSAWPDAIAARGFTLKPRQGTSGRGRVGGDARRFDAAKVSRSAGRLALRGGAILEPWLQRVCDLSVVMWIASPETHTDGPPVTLLGCFEQLVSESGLWLGHCGEIDRRGRIYSGTRWDDDMREAAACAAEAAREAGHFGPCGIDGFSYVTGASGGGSREAASEQPRDPASRGRSDAVSESRAAARSDAASLERARLRPLIELNARFTLGHVCAGWLRRVHAELVAQAELAPGRRVPFLFALAAPSDDADWPERVRDAGALGFDLTQSAATPMRAQPPGPFLLFHDDPERLRPLARRITGRRGAPEALREG